MRIISLELRNYKRLLVSNIEKIVYKPVEKMQVIIGSNGSGKSSLLKELSPLPAIKNEYTSTGYKEIVIEYMNSSFVLTSDFTNSHTHSFIKDGLEYNEGGTFTIQKDLVKQYFKLTFDLQELLLGNNNFTEFTALERRKWFTLLSQTDYAYALLVFNKLKEKQRDLLAGIKLSKAKLTTLESNILNEEDIRLLQSEIDNDNKAIESLLELKHSQVQMFNVEATIQTNKDNLDKLVKGLQVYFKQLNYNTLVDNPQSLIVQIETQISYLHKDNQLLERKMNEYQSMIEIMSSNNVNQLKDIQNELETLTNRQISLSKQCKSNIGTLDPFQIKSALNANCELLNYVFNNLKVNSEKEYSKLTYQQTLDQVQVLENKLREMKIARDELYKDIKLLEHSKNHDPIHCPECNHSWILGYDENIYQEKLKLLEEKNTNITISEGILENVIKKKLEDIREYIEVYRQYLSIRNNWSILSTFFKLIEDNNLIFDNPSMCNTILNQYMGEIETQCEIYEINKKLNDLKGLLAFTQSTNQNVSLDTIIKDTDLQISRNINEITQLQKDLKAIQRQVAIKEKIDQYQSDIYNLLQTNEAQYKESIKQLENNIINSMINDIKLGLVDKETKLNNTLNIHRTIKDTNEYIQLYSSELEEVNILVNVMSPTNGLIGESILGFINVFIENVNSIINKIWSYSLIIQPCSIDETNELDLNYRFPVIVKNNDFPVPDIKKVSAGMKEIINLAFKIIAMKYLKLDDYPLYLDEFGRTFDEYHRLTALSIINNLLMQSDFSQIFLISHYADTYMSLTNADVNILCKENVTIPIISTTKLSIN